jgi:hypothetical protein
VDVTVATLTLTSTPGQTQSDTQIGLAHRKVRLSLALIQTPHRFRSKRQLWTYSRLSRGPFHDFYAGLLAKGMKPEMARLTLARKIAAITLTLWKKEERFDAEQLKTQAA